MKSFSLIALSLAAGILCAVEIPFGNPDFKLNNKGIYSYWNKTTQNAAAGTLESVMLPNGKGALKISSTTAQSYLGLIQHINFRKFPKLQPGEKLKITVKYKQKNEDVERGGFVSITGYGPKGRFLDQDSPRTSGSFDWKDCSFEYTVDSIPADTKGFFVSFYLGKTTGTVWFSEPQFSVEVVK